MSQSLIRQGFEGIIETWAAAQVPSIPVAWENVAFVAPVGRYVRVFLLPGEVNRLFMEGSGREYRGVIQVSLVMNIGAGAGGAEALLSSLDAAFSSSGNFTSGGLRIWLLTPFRASTPQLEADRWVLPVSASYAAVTT